jgi:hypothetical protein
MALFHNICAFPACPVGRNYRTGVKCSAYFSGGNLRNYLCGLLYGNPSRHSLISLVMKKSIIHFNRPGLPQTTAFNNRFYRSANEPHLQPISKYKSCKFIRTTKHKSGSNFLASENNITICRLTPNFMAANF